MSGPELLASELPLGVRKSSDGGMYEFGVVWDGVFVVLISRKTGGVDDDLRRERERAKDEPPGEPQAPAWPPQQG